MPQPLDQVALYLAKNWASNYISVLEKCNKRDFKSVHAAKVKLRKISRLQQRYRVPLVTLLSRVALIGRNQERA